MKKYIPEIGRELEDHLLDIWEGNSNLPPHVEEGFRKIWINEFKPNSGIIPDRPIPVLRPLPCINIDSIVEHADCNCPRKDLRRCDAGHGIVMMGEQCETCEDYIADDPNAEPESKQPDSSLAVAQRLLTEYPIDLNQFGEEELRLAHLHLLKSNLNSPIDIPTGNGRGIVMGVGGTVYFKCAWAAVAVLRSLGCTLPIEWWYLGRSEMDTRMLKLAGELGIICVDASKVAESLEVKPRILNGWELKPFSVAYSSFQEVLYLDADNMCVQDPTFLFDAPLYNQYGAIFWPDLPPFDRPEWMPPTVWKNVGLERRDEIDFESGQFLIDKGRRSKELAITVHINYHSDWYYKFVYGDKTTYHLAWRVCGSDYAIPIHGPGWTWPFIIQRDFNGNVLFEHVCQGKHQLASSDPLGLTHGEVSSSSVKKLRAQWHGDIWSVKDCTNPELELMKTLAGRYDYRRHNIGDSPSRKLNLLPSGRIGEGAAGCEQSWCIRIIEETPTLVIVGEAHKGTKIGMMFLTEIDGVWTGKWEAHEREKVELRRI